jgi:hypothetical protein
MKLGISPITRMELWLRKNQERKRNQLVSVLLANADGLGKSRILVQFNKSF